MLNLFFTNISSNSLSSQSDGKKYIDDAFMNLKRSNKIQIRTINFKFVETTHALVENLLLSLDSKTGPGISEIQTKVIKSTLPKKSNVTLLYDNLTIAFTN